MHFDCLLVTREGVRRAWVVSAGSEEILETLVQAARLMPLQDLERLRLEMTGADDDLVRLELDRSGTGILAH